MASRFKLTSMELGALCVLTLVVAAITITLTAKSCSDGRPVTANNACDSLTSVVERQLAEPDSLTSVGKTKAGKRKKAVKAKTPRKTHRQRNYLDEPVNE